jgi:hypothetical protein
MKHFLALVTLSPILLAPTVAQAADEQAPRRWVDQHTHPHGPGIYDKADRANPNGTKVYGWSSRAPGTRVYGWRGCDDYHYWNGTSCVDARDTPP